MEDSVSDLYASASSGSVWFRHYVFVLQTMISEYPLTLPDSITKKRYYYYLTNLAHTMPDGEHRRLYMEAALTVFPLSPCLDSREDLFRWLHRVCNYISVGTGGGETEAKDWIESYREWYKPDPVIAKETQRKHRIVVFLVLMVSLFLLGLMAMRSE
jgi:hypothetical protein